MSYGCKNAHVVTIVGPDAAKFHGSDPWKGRLWCRSLCWFLMLAPLSHCQFLIGIVRCLTKALQRNILSNLCSSWLDTNFERERDWLLNPQKEHNRTRFPPSRTPHGSHAKELTRVLWPLRWASQTALSASVEVVCPGNSFERLSLCYLNEPRFWLRLELAIAYEHSLPNRPPWKERSSFRF